MTTIIEIASIRPPKEGKKVGTVVANTGQSFEIWPDKMNGLAEGGRYEIEIREREWNSRTIRQITKAKEVMQTATTNTRTTDPRPQSSATAGADQEVAFVTSVLNAFIAAGHVKPEARELASTTTLLRMLWSSQFGPGLNTFRASEAGISSPMSNRQ